ncbi:MAG: flagellar basal body-associated FliL family protein [Gammaproteobacteria bacterium]|nr:flagellar basal body-associated FliL family protein [Gammaproteobacteria bacterium]
MLRIFLTITAGVFCVVVQASSGSGEAGASPYYEITTPFVVNLQDETATKFLQVNAQLRLNRPDLKSQVTRYLPMIQHSMMLLLSEQDAKVIRSVEGKQKLREQALKEIQTVLEKETGEPVVAEVLFTGFIIQ